MKKIILMVLISLFAGSIAIYAGVNAERDALGLTLKDCYALALKRSETISIQKEFIKETEGLMLQSLSTALPKVAFAYSQTWRDVRPNDTFGGYQPEAKFTFTQPLFTGFKEIAAIRASKHIGKQREAELKRAKQMLFSSISVIRKT